MSNRGDTPKLCNSARCKASKSSMLIVLQHKSEQTKVVVLARYRFVDDFVAAAMQGDKSVGLDGSTLRGGSAQAVKREPRRA